MFSIRIEPPDKPATAITADGIATAAGSSASFSAASSSASAVASKFVVPQVSARLLQFAALHDSQSPPLPHTTRPELSSSKQQTLSLALSIPASSILHSDLFPRAEFPSAPPSPRTQRNPLNRVPGVLFPSTHTDKRGFLLPPIANPDLPQRLEAGGDSFWIGEDNESEEFKRERQRILHQAHAQPRPKLVDEAASILSPDTEAETEDPLFWDDVIDAALLVCGKQINTGTGTDSESEENTSSRHQGNSVKSTTERKFDTEIVD